MAIEVDLECKVVAGVETVKGQGVNNDDPKNPVLTFPDADEVDDSSTANKFVNQDLLDEHEYLVKSSNILAAKYFNTNNTYITFSNKIVTYQLNALSFSINIDLDLGIGSEFDQYFLNLGNFGSGTDVSGLYIRYQKANGKIKIGFKSDDNLTNISAEDTNVYDVGDNLDITFISGVLTVNGNEVVDYSAYGDDSHTLGTELFCIYTSIAMPSLRVNNLSIEGKDVIISEKGIYTKEDDLVLVGDGFPKIYGEGIQDLKVTVSNSANQEIFVEDENIKHTFRYVEDAGIQQKIWRYLTAVTKRGDETIMTTGDSEGVYRVSGAPDFVGGIHGDEEYIVADFYLDGIKIDPSIDKVYYGNKIERYYLTDMYQAGGVPAYELEANRYSFFSITKGKIKYNLKFTFQKALDLAVVYMGMSSLAKVFKDLFVDTGYLTPDSLGTLYDYESFICKSIYENVCTAETKITYKNTPSGFVNGLRIFGSTPYNKVYYGMLSTLAVSIGDIYECEYETDFKFF